MFTTDGDAKTLKLPSIGARPTHSLPDLDPDTNDLREEIDHACAPIVTVSGAASPPDCIALLAVQEIFVLDGTQELNSEAARVHTWPSVLVHLPLLNAFPVLG
jgi:hypothetical protein